MISGFVRDLDDRSSNRGTVSADALTRDTAALSKHDITSWLQGVEAGNKTPGSENAADLDNDLEPSIHRREAELGPTFIPIKNWGFLRAELPWKWLTAKLSSCARLSWPHGELDDEVSNSVAATIYDTATCVQEVECQLEWDPISFLSMHYDQNSPPRLGDVVTMTGWENQVQSMTCFEYIQQTWPLYGVGVLYAVQDAIRSPYVRLHCKCTSSKELTAISTTDSGFVVYMLSYYHAITDLPRSAYVLKAHKLASQQRAKRRFSRRLSRSLHGSARPAELLQTQTKTALQLLMSSFRRAPRLL
jgi:hypothetical protein